MDEFYKVKAKIKLWEKKFQARNNREPTKGDITDDPAIQGLYLQFNKLKKDKDLGLQKVEEFFDRARVKVNQRRINLELGSHVAFDDLIKQLSEKQDEPQDADLLLESPQKSSPKTPSSFLSPVKRNSARIAERLQTSPLFQSPTKICSKFTNVREVEYTRSTERRRRSLDEGQQLSSASSPPIAKKSKIEHFDVLTAKVTQKKTKSDLNSSKSPESTETSKKRKGVARKKDALTRNMLSSNFVRCNMNRKKIYAGKNKQEKFAKWRRNNRYKKWKNDRNKAQNFAADEENGDEAPSSSLPSKQPPAGKKSKKSTIANENDMLLYSHRLCNSEFKFTPFSHDNDVNDEMLRETLRSVGLDEFKKGQERAITRILDGQSTVAVFPTGGGKTLCYQIPAMLYSSTQNTISVFVTPLLAIINDQLEGGNQYFQPVWLKNDKNLLDMREYIHQQMLLPFANRRFRGHVFVTPEYFVKTRALQDIDLPPISFVCFDEAHCLVQWAHNFRPAYIKMADVIRRSPIRCLLFLTATACKRVLNTIYKAFGLCSDANVVPYADPIPPNLHLSAMKTVDIERSIVSLFRSPPFADKRSVIVYANRRDTADRVAQLLRTHFNNVYDDRAQYRQRTVKELKTLIKSKRILLGKNQRKDDLIGLLVGSAGCGGIEAYHAGISNNERSRIQRDFMLGRIRILCATVAFGLGLDKKDIGGIIHYNLPMSLESYVQECGRSGRDGSDAHCVLFYNPCGNDVVELTRHIFGGGIDNLNIHRFVESVLSSCLCSSSRSSSPHLIHEIDIDRAQFTYDCPYEVLYTVLLYLEEFFNSEDCKYDCVRFQVFPITPLNCELAAKSIESDINMMLNDVSQLKVLQDLKGIKRLKQGTTIGFHLSEFFELFKTCIRSDCESVRDAMAYLSDVEGIRCSMSKAQCFLYEFDLGGADLDETLDCAFEWLVQRNDTRRNDAAKNVISVAATMRDLSIELVENAGGLSKNQSDAIHRALTAYLSLERELPNSLLSELDEGSQNVAVMNLLEMDIRRFIGIYYEEHPQLSPLVIARIFQGVSSPQYQAIVWGSTEWWRCHVNVSFGVIQQCAQTVLNKVLKFSKT